MNRDIESKLIGSGIAGLMETSIFHPFDTTTKRLMSNKNKISLNNFYNTILQKKHNKTTFSQFKSLYHGYSYSICHRFTQRMYSYGGQSIFKGIIFDYYKPETQQSRICCEYFSGAIIGVGEIIFLPIDVLKIKKQTNNNTFKNRSLIQVIKDEEVKNYFRGAGITAMRNYIAIGNFFMVNGIIREYYYHRSSQWNMPFSDYVFLGTISSIVSIVSSSPCDVIKTRIQNKNFGEYKSSYAIIKDISKHEGLRAFYKGIVTKIFTICPKIIFTYSVSQYLISYLQKKN